MSSDEKIGLVGVGRLGLCAALCLERAGYDVVGCDLSEEYCRRINDGTLQSPEPQVMDLLQRKQRLRATTKLQEVVDHAEMIWIFVDTPSGSADQSYDHSKLSGVLLQLNALRLQNKHVMIGCTVLPGYIRTVGRFLLKDCVNTTLNYNPEFIAQGAIIQGFVKPDMVLIGAETAEAAARIEQVYSKVCENKPVVSHMSAESAEICKLSINCAITMKIAFANAIGDTASVTAGADANAILQAVGADSRIGPKCLKPGYGFGGPCFPRDNRALGNYMASVGVTPHLARATDAANHDHAMHQVNQRVNRQAATDKVGDQKARAEDNEVIVFEDVAYKPQCAVPIIEHSQKLKVASELAKRHGRKVLIRDRRIIIHEVMKEFGCLFDYDIID